MQVYYPEVVNTERGVDSNLSGRISTRSRVGHVGIYPVFVQPCLRHGFDTVEKNES